MEPLEVAVTSDSTGQLWSSSVWDVHTGTSLACYRGGGVPAPRSLCIVGEDYIASLERTKPILHLWPLNSQEQVQGMRFVLPGHAKALAFTPDACYCIVGIDEKIFIWKMASGSLLATVSRHYQTITSIKVTDDGSHIISAADDGLVLVWNLGSLVSNPGIDFTSQSVAGQQDPLYIFSNHSLPVTDIYVGKGGIRCRLLTVSMDRTCKVYDLSSGDLLLNLVFDKSLTAVTMDIIEMNIFTGTVEGDIYQFSIVNPPRMREYYLNTTDKGMVFSGHSKAVTCLSISRDEETLISGSNDEQLFVWHIPSRQKKHVIPHKGPITNAFFIPVPKNLFANEFDPSIILHSLQRTIDTNSEIEITTKECNDFWNECEIIDEDFSVPTIGLSSSGEANAIKMENELKRLKEINQELYQHAIKYVLRK